MEKEINGQSRERLGSRLGFILLSAGCAIGCGNVWKFPWMCGQYGGGAFVLVYLICLVLLGIPVMVAEFALGRASQASPVAMYKKLEPAGSKWHVHGYFALAGNCLLMMFYTTVTGWMINYFAKFVAGQNQTLGFADMIGNPSLNVICMGITVVLGFIVLAFNLQGGLERVTKIMMAILMVLMIVLAIHSFTLSGAGEGLKFYLLPDLTKITPKVIVGAMNQAFFTLSLGIGSMAIFGSYIGKERSLAGESLRIIGLDTFVAIFAGLIIFPACFTYDIEAGAGPSLLFESMKTVFNNMEGGRIWGALFFLFMVFAAFSTVLAVFENILACVRELTGWSRPKGCLICGVGLFLLSLPCALGYSTLSFIDPFAIVGKSGTAFLDLWDFLVSNCLLPLGALIFSIFCVSKKGWGWDNFIAEANTGEGLKFPKGLKNYMMFVLPVLIAIIFVMGMIDFFA